MAREKLGGMLLVAVLVVGLAAPAHAVAPETKKYKGELEGGGSISLRLNADGDPVVDKIFLSGVPVACEKGGQVTIGYYEVRGSTPLRDGRRFAVTSKDGSGGKAKAKGRFSKRFRSVSGNVRVYGKYTANGGATVSGCDSGKVPFDAK